MVWFSPYRSWLSLLAPSAVIEPPVGSARWRSGTADGLSGPATSSRLRVIHQRAPSPTNSSPTRATAGLVDTNPATAAVRRSMNPTTGLPLSAVAPEARTVAPVPDDESPGYEQYPPRDGAEIHRISAHRKLTKGPSIIDSRALPPCSSTEWTPSSTTMRQSGSPAGSTKPSPGPAGSSTLDQLRAAISAGNAP